MKRFTPTKDQVRLAEAVLTAMAHESLIRPIVTEYETAILNKHQFKIAREWVEQGEPDRVILDRKHSFLLSEEDAKVYYAECFAARDAANLKVDRPENCPLLVAEDVRGQAENALLKAIAAIPGLELLGSGGMTLDERTKAIQLTLQLLAPFVADAEEILRRILGPANCSANSQARTDLTG